MSRRLLIELNTDFKPKLLRRRKEFMEHFLRAMTGDNPEDSDKILEYGVRIISERDNGDDMAVMVNGETVFRVR